MFPLIDVVMLSEGIVHESERRGSRNIPTPFAVVVQ
jgi:hypothetical protein